MIIDKFHISLFNILDELIYIYDYKTLDVLFLNNKAKNIFKIANNMPLKNDIIGNTFFSNPIALNEEIGNESKFINFEGRNYTINKSPAIYNDRSVVLCVCNEVKNTDFEKDKKYLEMKDILIKSVSILAKDEDLSKVMYEILEMIGLYYNADRCYINEELTNGEEMVYLYQWDSAKNDNIFSQIPSNNEIVNWGEIYKNQEILFIDDISILKEVWPEKYKELKEKDIKNLVIAIMKFLEKPVGFMCIENIEEHKNDILLLKSLLYFILNEFKRRQISKKLTFMSFQDSSTGLNNRNKYANYIENIKYSNIKSMGVAFVDINGINKINETQGQECGDRAIKEVSEALKKYFRKEDIYRIGGDEFVVLSENITKDTFSQKVNSVNRYFLDLMEYSVSIGYLWRDKNLDIKHLTRKADEYMYQAKKTYYDYFKNNGIEVYSSMATESEYEEDKVKIILGHDTELDFKSNRFTFESKQEIFKFKVKQLINNKPDKKFVMVMLDINGFKVVNEMYGFDEGNKILLRINHIINKFIFGKGICCHSYSDVYYFCCESKNDEDILKILYDIDNEISQTILNIKIALSYGIYRIQDKNIGIEEIIERVNYAHKISKKDTTKNINFYDEELKNNMLVEKQIENDMDEALANEDFKLYLQPKYNIYTNKINGAEALVRWEHIKKGLMFPGSFIPIFEKNGFIMKLDMYILEQVCKFIKSNEEKGRRNISISVNISKLNFRRKELKDDIMEIINRYKVDPKFIELEITESLIAEEPDEIIKVIQDFKKENIRISMDDFGTGYSSLNMLQDLPVDVLKIDCGFFRNFEKSKKGAAIIKSIVMLAKELELDVVAEGIEIEEEVEYLKEIGCSNVQGYYFCKPVTLEEFEKRAFADNG
ncbi:EAL domain-containing protein [uncultured Tyzzerella sp.]|uniref:EAL domain-containing protein n=1 Tax=uncultured Tyzzerella sp. TaxID=2321398 RepID=UPI002941CC30|nr:EAL domain-containing protein [uncultured Tyzzerella sp.]